jgi:hypothetical protein
VRPPSPAGSSMKPTSRLPGSPYAVATRRLKPMELVRPRSPARAALNPTDGVPGSPFLRGRHES